MAEENKLDLMDSHGVLNDMREKNPKTLDAGKTDFLAAVRNETRNAFKPTKLSNKNEFRALVLRNDTMKNLSANSQPGYPACFWGS